MKKNDIFEHEAEGIKLRFQLVELKPYLITIQTLDLKPPLVRSGNRPLVTLPKASLATKVNSEFTTTEMGERWAKEHATYICNRLAARNKSLRWLTENQKKEQKEATALITKLDKQLDDWEVKYLLAIVRWANNGEIDPGSENDIKRVKNILLSYSAYLRDPNNYCGEKVRFGNLCFKLVRDGQPDRFLRTMVETESFLWPWTNKSINSYDRN